MKKTFWTNAEGFSIVDLLAISYSGTYLSLIISNIAFQNVKLTDLLDTIIGNNGKIIHSPITGYWIDIGKHDDYRKAQDLIKHI